MTPAPTAAATRRMVTASSPSASARATAAEGAHPRYARGTGDGTPALDATSHTPVHITLHTDSVLTLPHGSEPGRPSG